MCDVDVVDDGTTTLPTPATKKDNILERINKRNKDRQNYLDVKLEQRNKENLQFEGADYFAQAFGERAHEIETRIKNITESATKRPNTDISHIELVRLFSNVTIEIQELQRYLTSSTIFLTDFKIKACQNILNDLTTSSEDTRLKLLPKKKFGFSASRKAAPKNSPSIMKPTTDKLDCYPEKSSMPTAGSTNTFSWTLANLNNAHICLREAEVNGQDVTISNLSDCLVELQGHAGSVQISNATNCTFLCGPISRSLFAEHCRNCTFAVACQQLRLHSSTTVRIYLHVTCRAIIEDSKHIEIAEYCYDYPDIANDFQKAGLDKALNNYIDIADFNWLSPDAHSPNWKLLKDCAKPNWSEVRRNFTEKNSVKSI